MNKKTPILVYVVSASFSVGVMLGYSFGLEVGAKNERAEISNETVIVGSAEHPGCQVEVILSTLPEPFGETNFGQFVADWSVAYISNLQGDGR